MSKTKHKHVPAQPINATRFIAGWLFASVAVWPTVVVVGTALGMITSVMITTLSLTPFAFLIDIAISLDPFVPYLLFVILVGLCIGLSIGVLQKAVMHHYLRVNVERWVLYSVLGGIVGTGLWLMSRLVFPCMDLMGCYAPVDPNRIPAMEVFASHYAMIMAIVLTGLSMLQWVWLRKQVGDAWLWVLANAMGGITFMMLLWNQPLDLLGAMSIAACLGAITGVTLLWLFRNRRIETVRFISGSPIAMN